MRSGTLVLFLSAFLCTIGRVSALIHHLTIHNDDRTIFKIETFGFVAGGKMQIRIADFSMHFSAKELGDYKAVEATAPHNQSAEITLIAPRPKPHMLNDSLPRVATGAAGVQIAQPTREAQSTATTALRRRQLQVTFSNPQNTSTTKSVKDTPTNLVGFVMRHASSENAAQSDIEQIIERRQCILEKLQPKDVFIDLSNSDIWKDKVELVHIVTEDNIGLYSLIFARCYPTGRHYTSFKVDATFHNPGPNYLSAGDTPLPTLYFVFFGLFSVTLALWVWVLRRDPVTYGTVHRIHHMMLGLLVLKCLSLFFEGVRYHYISIYGVSEMWSAVYYVFAFLKGIMLFTVILLIGSGWSLMKSFLNENEKRIVWFVLVLQVLDNVAMIILEETAPGSQGWLTWRDILHLVDIICCCAILMPIVWSIRHLRQAAEVDGKAQNSLQKLQLFRQFYVMVVVYVYFTRIVVYVLAATVPFYYLWLGPLATETATLIFFTVTGYKFRPAVDSPYLPVRSEDSEGLEYGLEEEDELLGGSGVQLQPSGGSRKSSGKK